MGKTPGIMRELFLRLKCAKSDLQAFTISEILPRLYPGPPLKEGVIYQLCYCANNN
jgi:hypothetical protein